MGIYEALEERYYSFLDWLDEHGIPLWKLAQPIEAKGIPSFPIFAGIALAILAGVGWGIYALFFGPKVYVVTVLDPSGNPIAGAVVSVGGETYRTGPDGTVELELKGDEQIIIMATGYEDTLVTAEELSEPVVLKPLVQKAKIFVVDTRGRPVNATVRVFGKNGTKTFEGSTIEFNIARVETDDAVVMGDTLRVEAYAEGYEKQSKTLRWDAPAATIRLRKEAPPTATLYVVTDPPANGWVHLMNGRVTVDRALLKYGRAVFYGVQYGTYTLHVVPIVGGSKYDSPENTFQVDVRSPSVTKTLQIVVPDENETLETVVYILDANTKKPLSATVFVAETNATYSAPGGVFKTQMKHGETLTLTISATKHYSETVKVSAGDERNVYLERTPAVGSVVVEVSDVHGLPVQGATAVLLDKNDNVVAEANAPTDEDGEVAFIDVLVGEYYVEVCKGSVCARSKPFEVEEDEITHVPVLLVPGYGEIDIELSVGGVPSAGHAKAVRISTGEVLKEADIDIDGRGALEEVPAYVKLRVEVSAASITYVSPAFMLLPNETRTLTVEIPMEVEEGFEIEGVYVGGQRVGIVEAGKRYTLRVSFACKGSCSQTFTVENGTFVDTDWPGDYSIGSGESSAAEGNTLTVSIDCPGTCMGTFDVDVNVGLAPFGERLTITYGDRTFSVPIAYEGFCSGDLCAFAIFERKDKQIAPMDLYEELKYDMNLGIVWGGGEIPYARLTVKGSGPADLEINGEREYEFRGRLGSGAFITLSGSAYAEDPGYESIDIVVSTCDPAYINCTDVGSLSLSAYFQPEPDNEATLIMEPDMFVGCPFQLTVRLVDEEGRPIVFNSETMLFKAFGVTEDGVKTPLSYSWESDRITISFNGADYDSVEVHFDGFGYAEAEARVFRSDPQLEPETYPEGEDVGLDDTLTFTFQNSSDMNLLITGVSPNLPGLDTEVRSLGCRGEGMVPPNGEASIELKVNGIEEDFVGEQQSGALEVHYTPLVEGVGDDCGFTAVAPATYTPLPSCLKISARQAENGPNIEVNVQNTCSSLCPTDLVVRASAGYECDPVPTTGECVLDPGSSVEVSCWPSSTPTETSTINVKVTAIATYETDTQEYKYTGVSVIYVPESCRGTATFKEDGGEFVIDPNSDCILDWSYECNAKRPDGTGCGCKIETNGVYVAHISAPGNGCNAKLNGAKVRITTEEEKKHYIYAYYTPGWYDYKQNKCCEFCSSTLLAKPPATEDNLYIMNATLLLPISKLVPIHGAETYWYDPFPLLGDGEISASVSVLGYFSEGYYGPWAFYEINSQTVTLKELNVFCDGNYVYNGTCGEVYVAVKGGKPVGISPGGVVPVELATSHSLAAEGNTLEDYINLMCKGISVDGNLYLVRSSGVSDALGCGADPFLVLEASEIDINAYWATFRGDSCDEAIVDCNIHAKDESPTNQDRPKVWLQATDSGVDIVLICPTDSRGESCTIREYNFETKKWSDATDNWNSQDGRYIYSLDAAGYHPLAAIVNALKDLLSTSGEQPPEEVNILPVEMVVNSSGQLVYNLQARPPSEVPDKVSNLRIWGYGPPDNECKDNIGILLNSGLTVWYPKTQYENPQDVKQGLVFAACSNENECDNRFSASTSTWYGFISKTAVDELNLVESYHYKIPTTIRVIDAEINVYKENDETKFKCENGGTLYAVAWHEDRSGFTYTEPADDSQDRHVLFMCIPADAEGLFYDENIFNNFTIVEMPRGDTGQGMSGGEGPCTCDVSFLCTKKKEGWTCSGSTSCNSENKASLEPGGKITCYKEDDIIQICYYACVGDATSCYLRSGCIRYQIQ